MSHSVELLFGLIFSFLGVHGLICHEGGLIVQMVSSTAIASSYHTAAAYGGAITPPHAVLNDNDPNNTTVCCNAFCKKFWHHQNCDYVEMGHVLWTVLVLKAGLGVVARSSYW